MADETLPGLITAGDLSAAYQKFVKMGTADRTVVIASATTDVPIGVLVNKPDAAGQAAEVASFGSVTKVTYGGTITRGDFIGVDAAGDAISVVATTTTIYMLGIALESGADGDVRQVLLISPFKGSA